MNDDRPVSTTTLPVATTTTIAEDRRCIPASFGSDSVDPANPVAAAFQIARSTFQCAEELTLSAADDAAVAAAHAVSAGGPLLFVGSKGLFDTELAAAVEVLAPAKVTMVGLEDLDPRVLGDFEVERLGDLSEPMPAGAALNGGDPSRLWLVADDAGPVEFAAHATAAAAGDALLVLPGGDLRGLNTVLEWLARIVREEALPQKLLVLHQFRVAMIRGRETVNQPPELAVILHADGQGGLKLRYDTWGVLTTQLGSETPWWGWKSFYDEDLQLATPQQVLE